MPPINDTQLNLITALKWNTLKEHNKSAGQTSKSKPVNIDLKVDEIIYPTKHLENQDNLYTHSVASKAAYLSVYKTP